MERQPRERLTAALLGLTEEVFALGKEANALLDRERNAAEREGRPMPSNRQLFSPAQLAAYNKVAHARQQREKARRARPGDPAPGRRPRIITAGEEVVSLPDGSTKLVKRWRKPWADAVMEWAEGLSAMMERDTGHRAANYGHRLLQSAHLLAEKLCPNLDCKRDVLNGYPLTAGQHALYDAGYLTIDDNWKWVFSPALSRRDYLDHGVDPLVAYVVPESLRSPEAMAYIQQNRKKFISGTDEDDAA